jgi:MFS family permease
MDLRLLALLLGLVSTVNESALTPALPFLARDLGVGAAAAQGVVGLVPGLAAAAYPKRRGYALGLVASTVAAGTLLGPALGGLLTGSLGWPYVFLLPLPLALLALSQSGRLPELPPQGGT